MSGQGSPAGRPRTPVEEIRAATIGELTPRTKRRTRRTKRELAAQDWDYVQHYVDARTAVVEAIIARAMASPSTLTTLSIDGRAPIGYRRPTHMSHYFYFRCPA